MLTIATTLCFFGFYLFYSTSKRAVLEPRDQLQRWVTKHEQQSKYLGAGGLLTSLCLFVVNLGPSSGIFSYLVLLMTIASSIVIAGPLQLIRPVYLTIIALMLLVLEIYIRSYAG